MIYPSNFEIKTGFEKIRELVSRKCLCSLGKDQVNAMTFLTNPDSLHHALKLTDEFRQLIQIEQDFPMDNYLNVTPVLKKLRIVNTYPETGELFSLKKSLETIKSILNFIKKLDDELYPGLKKLASGVKSFPAIHDRTDSIMTSQGRIKDNASPELLQVRREIKQKQSEISKRVAAVFKNARQSGWIDKEAEITIRDGRMVIPVNASDKRRISGYIHDESASGKTVFIEPAEAVELNNQIREAENREKREIIKILTQFADFLRPYLNELHYAYAFMGQVDFLMAKARFATEIGAILPELVQNPIIEWYSARHPLLYLNFKKENREVVPLSISLDEENRILVISGPNAGGKSVCLQTVGLLQYMFQCGMLVPVSDGSKFGIFSGIFIDIGDEQSLENDLSTYSSHLINMKMFLKHAGKGSMILIDEFGTGTEPMMGGAIAESVLDKLNQMEATGVITTHYTNLKLFASETPGIINGAMLFDTNKMEPLFQLKIGSPGSSFAFEIAHRTGIPEEILEMARSKVGEEQVNFDKHLREVLRDKRYWEEKRHKIRKSEKKLEELIDKYTGNLEESKQSRKEIISKAREEAKELLAGVNKKIENTIREIREAQAEKEKTKKLRKELEEFGNTALQSESIEYRSLSSELKKIKQNNPELFKKKEVSPPEKKKSSRQMEVGDKVKLFNQDAVGEVLDVNGKSIMVAFGNMITTVNERKLTKLGDEKYEEGMQENRWNKPAFNIAGKRLTFKTEIDLRGKRAEEALDILSRYIDEAIMLNTSEVRILHGKGTGVLREIIRDYLQTVESVKNFKDEHADRGGPGITIVRFK
ncbi:MAG: endonuclease MutS2 [Bacteroidota bacterium]